MSYQINIVDAEGSSFLCATADDMHQAKKRITEIKEANGTDSEVVISPQWKSIELYRVDLISVIHLDESL